MARIAGVDIPNEKRVEVSLSYVYGVGIPLSRKILAEAKVSPDTRVKNLTEDEVARISKTIEKMSIPVEGELRRIVTSNIRRLQEITSSKEFS